MTITKLEDIFALNQGAQPQIYDRPNTFFQEIYFEPVPDTLNYAPPIKKIMDHLKMSGLKTDAIFLSMTSNDNHPQFGLAFETRLPIAIAKDIDRLLGESLREQDFVPGYKMACDSKNVYWNYKAENPDPSAP